MVAVLPRAEWGMAQLVPCTLSSLDCLGQRSQRRHFCQMIQLEHLAKMAALRSLPQPVWQLKHAVFRSSCKEWGDKQFDFWTRPHSFGCTGHSLKMFGLDRNFLTSVGKPSVGLTYMHVIIFICIFNIYIQVFMYICRYVYTYVYSVEMLDF